MLILEEIVAFAEKNGCTATLDELQNFFEKKAVATGELSDEDLAQVAGGKSGNAFEALLSVFTAGLACAGTAVHSAIAGKCGTGIQGEGMLCEV